MLRQKKRLISYRLSATKVMAKDKKTKWVGARLTEPERDALHELASSEGMNLSDFLRALPETYPKNRIVA